MNERKFRYWRERLRLKHEEKEIFENKLVDERKDSFKFPLYIISLEDSRILTLSQSLGYHLVRSSYEPSNSDFPKPSNPCLAVLERLSGHALKNLNVL